MMGDADELFSNRTASGESPPTTCNDDAVDDGYVLTLNSSFP